MGYRVIRRWIFIGLCSAGLIGCGTDDGPVAPWLGDRPGQGSDPLIVIADSVVAETSFVHTVTLGSGGFLFIGQDGGYEARSLVRFNVSDTTITEFGEGTLTITFQSPQELAPTRFLLNRASSPWTESHVTWERAMIDSLGDVAWDTPGGDIEMLPISEAGPCSLQADTVTVVFPLSRDIMTALFESGSDDCGFMIRLASEGMEHAIWRFQSREQAVQLRPRLEFDYTDTAGTDTSKTLYAIADAALIRRISPIDEDRLLVGSGVGFRTLLKFDLPGELDSTVTINRAELSVFCDTSRAFLDTKTLQVEFVDSTWNGDSTSVAGGYISQALAVPGRSEITFEMTAAMVSWLANSTDNNGLLIRSSVENNAITYCPLFPGESGLTDLTPRLKIYYTTPPTPPIDQGSSIRDCPIKKSELRRSSDRA